MELSFAVNITVEVETGQTKVDPCLADKAEDTCKPNEAECIADESTPQWEKIVGIAFFYVAILIVGIYATRRLVHTQKLL